jgi:hypothetical protein
LLLFSRLRNHPPGVESPADQACEESTERMDEVALQQKIVGAKARSEQFEGKAEECGPPLKLAPDGGYTVAREGERSLRAALATEDDYFYRGILKQIVEASWEPGRFCENHANFLLSVIKGIEPRDQTETMIATQMAVVHGAMMKMAPQLTSVLPLNVLNSYERAFNKLSRTFVMLLEALKRYRSGGEQKVLVQHVSVEHGGQAIVNQNLARTERRRRRKQKDAAAVSALCAPQLAPMEVLEELADSTGTQPLAPADSKK